MIPARKSAWFSRVFARDAERRLTRSFEAVRVRGLASLEAAARAGPVLVVTNHTAWWDPLVAIYIAIQLLGADAYALMDARNLERLPFFARVGAFGVDLADASDGARAIRYAVKLLRERRLVWIFAQGREVPITVRPIVFRPGSAEIARLAEAACVPGAVRYELGASPRPTVWLSFGEVLPASARREDHERAVACELDAIDRALVTGAASASDFEVVCTGRPARLFRLAEWALARLSRPRALG